MLRKSTELTARGSRNNEDIKLAELKTKLNSGQIQLGKNKSPTNYDGAPPGVFSLNPTKK